MKETVMKKQSLHFEYSRAGKMTAQFGIFLELIFEFVFLGLYTIKHDFWRYFAIFCK